VNELLQSAAALMQALDDECDLYGTLLELARREEHAIVRGDVEGLTRLTEEKEHLLELFAALETERMTAITAIASASGHDADRATLGDLVAALPGAAGAGLALAGTELRRQAIELRDANARNAELLRSSRDIVDRWIHYLRTLVGGTLNYSADGAPDLSREPRRLDRTA
jgi:flagellar biosynthesis/type III secretory pathway chaperone